MVLVVFGNKLVTLYYTEQENFIITRGSIEINAGGGSKT